MIPARSQLVSAHTSVTTHASGHQLPELSARLVPGAAKALVALAGAVVGAGGTWRVTQLWRSHEQQVLLRKAYQEGHGAPAQRPGTSAHQGGRAVDVSTASLAFPVAPDKQVDRLWELAIPLGWRPVIDRPDETRAERWHLDFFEDWEPVRARLGYTAAATAATLDLGEVGQASRAWGEQGALVRCVQVHLQRAGYDCGAVDGIAGQRTLNAMAAAKVLVDRFDAKQQTWAEWASLAVGLPSSATVLWAS